MGVSQEIVGGGLGGGKNVMAVASSGFLLAGTAVKAFAKISEKEMGVRTSFGKATRTKDGRFGDKRAGDLYGIVGPGFHGVMPFTHSIKVISTKDRTHDLDLIQIDSLEGKQIDIGSSIIWAVRNDGENPYRALFNADDELALTGAVANICTSGLRSVLDGLSEQGMKNQREVDGCVNEVCREDLLEYGAELKRLNLKTVTRTFGQMIIEAGPGMHLSTIGAIAAGPAGQAPAPREVRHAEGVPPLHVA